MYDYAEHNPDGCLHTIVVYSAKLQRMRACTTHNVGDSTCKLLKKLAGASTSMYATNLVTHADTWPVAISRKDVRRIGII